MADMSAAQWAALVLQDLGAPQSQNNIDNMLAWMASENTWPPPRNNPLNNGLGSGGGSGLGSYPSLEVAAQYAAQGLQGGITGAAAIGQALIQNAPFSTFHQATISATWSGDHYAGTDWARATSPSTMGVNGAASTMTQADWAALQSAGAEGGTAYLEAANAAAQTSGGGQSAAGGGNSSNTSSTDIGGVTYTGSTQQTTALSTLETNLANYGFSGPDLSNLTSWAWQEITSGADPSQVALDMLNPATTGGAIFANKFPTFGPVNQALEAQGQQPLAVSDFMKLTQSYEQTAQAAGLPVGMITPDEMATLMKNNVSPNELSDRLNTAMSYVLSTPAAQDAFNQYFGASYGQGGNTPLSLGQMTAIVLDPTKAEPLLQQQLTAAQIGGAGVTSGVGSLDAGTATKLAQAGITTAQATNQFQQLAPFATLETPRPGQANVSQGVVTPDQLASGALLGDPRAQRQLQTAEEVAKQPFAGGGGFVSNTKGAVGTGSASSSGAGNT